ncbi:MAG TPA: adenosylcobinamide-GDP ribazoletransferase [Victivallales bacterium]|nr:adenosylcobinamide-GDP ribazoletransferase [Victivallales bacterium]
MKNFKLAISFLTCIPVVVMDADDKSWLKSMIYYPFCGYIIGILVLIPLYLIKYFLISNPIVLAGLAVLILAYITRGLHIDGLADICDGFFCPASRNRRMEIMKDSRVGSFGVIGICLLFLIKFAVLYVIIYSGHMFYLLPAIVFSRFAMVFLAFIGRSASSHGLGQKIIGNVTPKILIISFICTIPCFFFSFKTLLAFVLMVLFLYVLNLKSKKLIGGINGDVLGASCELSEVIILLVLCFWL